MKPKLPLTIKQTPKYAKILDAKNITIATFDIKHLPLAKETCLFLNSRLSIPNNTNTTQFYFNDEQ